MEGKDNVKTEEGLKIELEKLRQRLKETEVSEARNKRLIEELRSDSAKYQAIAHSFDGLIYICSESYSVEFMNEKFLERTGFDPTGQKCYKALHDLDSICSWCVNERVFQGETVYWELLSPKDNRWYHIMNAPFVHPSGQTYKMSIIQDITDRKNAEAERERIKNQLHSVLKKGLSGYLSICSSCKKIRDSNNSWIEIESYIHSRTETQFSHSICPACISKLYPELEK
ncbi:MAG: PAS domain-containing protein [Candidatus Scalindua sp.]|nr:PAS domain-containing protein [Candidatus Scalindua sp.]